jgi:PIN domain nuclease of toxin-antitoxin system
MIVDTHVFLWWAEDSPHLTRRARAAPADGDARLI